MCHVEPSPLSQWYDYESYFVIAHKKELSLLAMCTSIAEHVAGPQKGEK